MSKNNGAPRTTAHFHFTGEIKRLLKELEPSIRAKLRPSVAGKVTDSDVFRVVFLEGLRALKATRETE